MGSIPARQRLSIIALGVTIFLLQYMQALLAPLAFGLLLFYALDPAVDAMEPSASRDGSAPRSRSASRWVPSAPVRMRCRTRR